MTVLAVLTELASLTFVAQTLRMSIPLGCAAVGGVLSERSGVVNIALEGILLATAFTAISVHVATGSAVLGLLAAILVGALFGLLHALAVVKGRVDAIVSGLALNLAAAGGTRALLRAFYHSSANSPSVSGFRIGGLEGASGARLLLRTLADPVTLLALSAAVLSTWLLARSAMGLWIRASGEDPVAARASAVPVERVRLFAVSLGGAVTALGGAALAYDQHQFQSGMSGGRGFIALAAVILSGWRPHRAFLACLAFASLDALQITLQGRGGLSPELVSALPYLATLAALVVVGRGGTEAFRAPSGLGKPPS